MRKHVRRGAARAVLVLPVVVTAALAAACSGSSASPGSSNAPTSSPSPVPSSSRAATVPGPTPSASVALAAASADEILAKAHDALLAARTVHAKGTLPTGKTAYRLDLWMVRKLGAKGRLTDRGTSLDLIRIKDVAYVQLDRAAWRAATGSDATARQFTGKYLKVAASNAASFKPFLAVTDLDQAFASLLVPTGSVTKGKVTSVNGVRVIDLKIDGGRTGDVYVALDGPAHPVRLRYPGGQVMDLDHFGVKVALTAPPASKIAAA